MRYAILVTLAAASVWALFNVSAHAGADAAGRCRLYRGGTNRRPERHRLLAVGLDRHPDHVSLFRFVLFGLPSMIDGWYEEQKYWIYTLHRRRRALRGVLFDVSGPIRNPFWGSLAGTLLPRRRGTRRRFGRPGQSGAVAQTRPPHSFRVSVSSRRCNTCRTRSGAASSRTARPLPSSARDKRRSRRR